MSDLGGHAMLFRRSLVLRLFNQQMLLSSSLLLFRRLKSYDTRVRNVEQLFPSIAGHRAWAGIFLHT